MAETPPSEDDLKLLARHWPHGRGADPGAVWAAAEAIYDGRKDWETEFATDLVAIKPGGKGGRGTGERIDRMMMKRWRSGERPLPEWVAEGLLRLPEIMLARRRKEIDRWLVELQEEERMVRDFIPLEEVRLAGWVSSQVEQLVPMIERDPFKRPPPPRPPTPDREWPAVSPDEIEAADDIGSLAARVEMGVVEPEPAPRPEHPVLADAWERGWAEAYDFELGRIREVEAAAEAEQAAKEKIKARKEARRAADLKRRLAKK